MNNMAIVKATYTNTGSGAKASIRYIEHRPGRDGQRITRTLFNGDGALTRPEAYQLIDAAQDGSRFFRFVISPDQKTEDTKQDLPLREITEQTMTALEDRLQQKVHWVAAVRDDHTPHRHVHIVAVVPGRLLVQDLKALRTSATEASLQQRRQLDLLYEQQQREQAQNLGKEAAWGLSY